MTSWLHPENTVKDERIGRSWNADVLTNLWSEDNQAPISLSPWETLFKPLRWFTCCQITRSTLFFTSDSSIFSFYFTRQVSTDIPIINIITLKTPRLDSRVTLLQQFTFWSLLLFRALHLLLVHTSFCSESSPTTKSHLSPEQRLLRTAIRSWTNPALLGG